MQTFARLVFALIVAAGVGAQQWSWQRLPATAHPPADGRVAMAFDPVRGRTVCVADEVVNATPWFTDRRATTWEWDGSRWLARTDVTTPPAGSHRAALTYDANRRGVVAVAESGGTWLFDGVDWQPVTIGGVTASGHTSLTFDTVRGVLVMLCGSTLFEEQGGQWVLCGSLQPAVWDDAEIAFDPATGSTIAFGGWNGTSDNNTTFRWDGTTLAPVPTATTPTGRSEHVLAFDEAAGHLVLAGGVTFFTPFGTLDSVHAWNGIDWVVQPSLPLRRRGAAAARVGSSLGVFGGGLVAATGQSVRGHELLLRTPAGWANVPQPASGACGAYDAARARTVSIVGDRTHEFDGFAWSDTGVVYSGATIVGLAYHTATARIVAFAADGATWTYDGVAWSLATTPQSPPVRSATGMAEDTARGVVVLAGGLAGSSPLADVWEWNGANWIARPSMPVTGNCSLTYDGVRIVAVVSPNFGGPADVLAWNGAAWTFVTPAPGNLVNRRLGFRPGLGVVMVAADYPIYSSADGASLLVGSTWQPLAGVIDARAGAGPVVYHAARGALVVHDTQHARDFVLTASPAAATEYGSGCASTAAVPRLVAPAVPQIGSTMVQDVLHATPNSFVFLLADSSPASIPLPGNCTALVPNPFVAAAGVTNGGGFASFAFPLPGQTALLGRDLFTQALVLDTAGALFGFANLTAGSHWRVGD